MLHTLSGIVLRTVKYGETSLIATAFTEQHGVQTFMLKGVRKSTKTRSSRVGLLQPGAQLDLLSYYRPGNSMHLVREFNPTVIYQHLQEDVVRNGIVLFSVELLLRLLPVEAPLPELFDFCSRYFASLDTLPLAALGNMPLYFTAQCGQLLGYGLAGNYSDETPYLNVMEGAFTTDAPMTGHQVFTTDAALLDQLLNATDTQSISAVSMNSEQRYRLLDWYIEFLQRHTQHLSNLKSLSILRTILH